VARARSRPPRLESRQGDVRPSPAPSVEELLDRAHVTGRSGTPGRAELRRLVERIVLGERAALGEMTPINGMTVVDAWAAMTAVFGPTVDLPAIDAHCTLTAAGTAARRIRDVASAGGRIAFATGSPASLLPMHTLLARHAGACGADIDDQDDVGPFRADGRTPRWIRWCDGVATLTDGESICGAHGGEAAREWVFVLSRPSLVVADGPFAEAAWEVGIEVVAFAGLDRPSLAIPAHRGDRATVVPLRTDRPPLAYRPLAACFADWLQGGDLPS
jgi:Phosphatase